MLRLAIDTHIITSHAAIPLLIKHPGGLVIEVTDGNAEFNAEYRGTFFYDLAKVTPHRMALALSKELADDQATAVSLTPGWIRSEAMLEHFGVTEDNWRDGTAKDPHFCISETPHYVARAAVALAADPERARFSGQSLASWDLGPIYGVTDLDGTQPQMLRYHREVIEAGKPADDRVPVTTSFSRIRHYGRVAEPKAVVEELFRRQLAGTTMSSTTSWPRTWSTTPLGRRVETDCGRSSTSSAMTLATARSSTTTSSPRASSSRTT